MSEQEAPSPNWGPTALDKSAESLIKQMESEFVINDVDTQIANVSATESTGETNAPGEPKAGVEVSPGVQGDSKPPVVPGAKPEDVSEAVRRELGLKAREDAVSAKETRIQSLEAELQSLRGRNLPEDVVGGLRTQATKTLEALGIDPDQVVRMVLAERLGDKAPPDLRQEITQASKDQRYQSELRALRQEIDDAKRQSAATAFYSEVQSGARKYIQESGISEHAPVVAKVAKQNPDRVYAEIMEEISSDARVKAARDPSLPLMTYEEAARRVETRWSELHKYLVPVASTQTQDPASTPAPKAPPQHTKSGTMSPPDRPLAPWLQRGSEIESEGLKAALAEWRRLETPAKAP